MRFLDQVLEFDRARAAGREAPVPVTGGRRVVCVVCPETLAASPAPAQRLGLDVSAVEVVAVPAARVQRGDGDVARAVALAAGACGGSSGGADVVVIGHDGCAYRSPTFAVPGPAPQGESFATARDAVRHSVAQLRASPWMARTNVAGLVLDASGRLDGVGDVAPAAVAATPAGSLGAPAGPVAFGAAGQGGSLAASGPVSFFGGAGAAGPSLASLPPVQAGPVRWDSPPPVAPGGVTWSPPPPIAPTTQMPHGSTVPQGAPVPQGATVAQDARVASGARMPVSPQMPSVGPLPQVTAEIPRVSEMPALSAPRFEPPPPPPPPPPLLEREPPPPPPRPAPPRAPQTRPPQGADDPFKRAEEILERLRRERRK